MGILARDLTDKYFPCSMKIRKILKHPDGRISNWWSWNEVLPNKTFGPEESGYSW